MISTLASFTTITILAFIYLDYSAASLVMTALVPLATVPLMIRTAKSVDNVKESGTILEESNHVICVISYLIQTAKL